MSRPVWGFRGISTVLLMALVLVVASCGVGQQGSQGDGDGGGGGGPARICMMPKLVGIPYFNASEKGAKEAAEELSVDLVYDGPTEARAAQQSQMIEQWIQQQCDAISVAANDPDALAPAMKKAQDAGISTSAWDADVAQDAREVFVNQATFEAIGKELVDVMAEQTDGQGEFLVVTGSLTAPNQVAWLKEMRAHMKNEYPEMSIASVEPGEEDLQKGIDITKNYLRANPDTAGVFGITSVALPGAAEAVQQMGLEGEVAVTGLSTPNEMKPYLESGAVEKFVLWNPVDLGYLAVHVANRQVEGDLPSEEGATFEAGRLGEVEMIAPDEVLLGPPLVFSSENIDEYDF
ncbi:MAG TPA: substrate-binding domain-containing protein [Rubrobacteraceae bacterium]|nr:substrate-binding domain-containing protein [Rubrobacteraceae bacterium]